MDQNSLWVVVGSAFGSGLIGSLFGFFGSIFISQKQLRMAAIKERKSELSGLYSEILSTGMEAARNYYSPEKSDEIERFMQDRAALLAVGETEAARGLEKAHQGWAILAKKIEKMLENAARHQAYVHLLVDDDEVKSLFEEYKDVVYLGYGEVAKETYFAESGRIHAALVNAMRRSVGARALGDWYKKSF